MWKSCLISCVVLSAFRDGPSPKNHTRTSDRREFKCCRERVENFSRWCVLFVWKHAHRPGPSVSHPRAIMKDEERERKKQTLKNYQENII